MRPFTPTPQLTDIKTFKLYLSGAMKRATVGIRLTEGNYNVAVKVPTDGYRRKDLGDEHTGSLLATEPLESSSPLSGLRNVYEPTQFRTRLLGQPKHAVCRVHGCSAPSSHALIAGGPVESQDHGGVKVHDCPPTQYCHDTKDARARTPSHIITSNHVVRLPARTAGCLPATHDLRKPVKWKKELF
ncbi:hypothetical protein MTO96_050552 [Rhipicephalus appendiculatus]